MTNKQKSGKKTGSFFSKKYRSLDSSLYRSLLKTLPSIIKK